MPRTPRAVLAVLASSLAFAAGDARAGDEADVEARRAGIELLLNELVSAYQHSDLVAAAALVDFPLDVLRAAPQGWVRNGSFGSEEWLRAVEPRFNGPRPDGAPVARPKRLAPVVSMITDSLAWVEDERLLVAATRAHARAHAQALALVIRKGRRWVVKAITERGWPEPASSPALAAVTTPARAH